jgi:hypothetical protein
MSSTTIRACLFLIVSAMFAQSDRGSITGTVFDSTGAVVAGAAINATNVETGAVYPTLSTATGNYTIPQVPPGPYEISVGVPGFKSFVRSGVTVAVAQTLRIDVSLEVGASSEAVTVRADAALLKTDSGDLSHNVTVQTLNDLPILGTGAAQAGSSGIRNPTNVAELIPGTFYAPNANIRVNGAPTNSEAIRVEGQDATNQLINFAQAETQPSVDAIQEVAIQTSNFAPEFGTVGGGLFNVTMRSGTNQYHGSGYDYFVNEALNAGTPFTDDGHGHLIRPPARRNDFGGTFGGPVWIPKLYNGHDKTFFFFNWEQFAETQHINNIPISVPTAAYRNGDFSQAITAVGGKILGTDALGRPLVENAIYDPTTARQVNGLTVTDQFPNNTVPQNRIDPVARKVQALIPQPTGPGMVNNYLPSYPSVRTTTIPALKLDQMIGSRGKLSFYWSSTQTDSQFSPIFGNSEGYPLPITQARGTFIHSRIFRLNYDHTLTPTLLLHFGAGYQQNNFFDDAPVLNYDAAQQLGLTGATIARNFPNFTGLTSPTGAGGAHDLGPPGQTHSFLEKPSANANATWVKNNHTLKFGAEVRFEGYPAIPFTNTNGNYAFSPNETGIPYLVGTNLPGGTIGFPYASFLLGVVDQVQIAAPSETRVGKSEWAVYLQDSWKVTRKLTLDYGLRWDYGTYPREQYGRSADFSTTTPNPSVGGLPGGVIFEGSGAGHCNCSFAKNYPFAIGPRVGLAYQIAPKTVLRAGWGVVYNQTTFFPASSTATATLASQGLGTPALTLANGIPFTPTWPTFSPGVYPLSGNINSVPTLIDPNAGRPARQNQWSIGLQHEISQNLVVEASYVGNRGVWWSAPGLVDFNALTPQALATRGLNINSPADQSLLLASVNSGLAASRGFSTLPYSGFPSNASVAQSLRPFPQFNSLLTPTAAPLGKTWYDSLQAKVTKRYSYGLSLTGAFTWAKSLQEGTETTGIPPVNIVNDVANRSVSKYISQFDQPFVFVLSSEYALPVFKTKKALSWALRDWKVGALLQYASGLPIEAPLSNTSLGAQLFQSTFANRVPGVPLYTVNNLNCRCYDPSTAFVLNPAAWSNPAEGQFSSGAAYYSDYRYQRHPQENMNLGRTFKMKERYSFSVRAEFTNIFNRTFLNNPLANNFQAVQTRNPVTGLNSGGFGWINTATTSTQFGQPRSGTIVARLTF